MSETILYRRAGEVGRLILNNPERHNSLGQEQLEALQAHFSEIASDPSLRVLLVTGAGEKTFCAGASLGQLGSGQISSELFQSTTDQLAALKIPTICVLNGSVYGGGVELALSCDFRIGIAGTRMRVPAAAIGLCYPLGGITRFVERLGVNVAKRILLTAEEFDAKAMRDIGFLDVLVEAEGLQDRANKMAENIAGLAPLAVSAMKEAVQRIASGTLDIGEFQSRSQQCADSADLKEGLAAQREKRAPKFQGR